MYLIVYMLADMYEEITQKKSQSRFEVMKKQCHHYTISPPESTDKCIFQLLNVPLSNCLGHTQKTTTLD